MAEIADSFESVWHGRTRLYEEVLQLRQQVHQHEGTIAELREQLRLRQDQPDPTTAPEDTVHDHARAFPTEDRQQLIDFLLDALKQVEQVPTNGSGIVAATSDFGDTGDGSRHVSAPAANGEHEENPVR